MRLLTLIAGLILALMMAPPVVAQGSGQAPATLIADSIAVQGRSRIVAQGAVEVFYNGTRVQAARVIYDQTTDLLTIEGPIRITDPDGTVLTATQAELAPDLQNGILRGARIVLDQQLQIAAAELARVSGRYVRMDKTVASSCQVCANNPTPLWEIRAARVIHDREAQQLYFRDAQFRALGVPIAYFPRLRMPDPTLDRATGFLTPTIRSTNRLGTGLRVPYFIALGQSRDLTPEVYTSGARLLGARYRQALRFGEFAVEGALGADDIFPGQSRGYLNVDGRFFLPRDFELRFDYESVSDGEFFADYDVAGKERLDSAIELTRTKRGEYISVSAVNFETLRTNESNLTLPTQLVEAVYERRLAPSWLRGRVDLRFAVSSAERQSSLDGEGRDVRRVKGSLAWREGWTLGNGMVAAAETYLFADNYWINQDSSFPDQVGRSGAQAMVELRWPFEQTTSAARHILEPVVQIVSGSEDLSAVPNEDSQSVEFDEGNLFSLSRFTGDDVLEQGTRINLGLNWTRYADAGWSLAMTAGRIWRAEDLGQFTFGSGMDGADSDWLVAARLDTGTGWSLTNRSLFGDEGDFSKSATQVALDTGEIKLAANYLWLGADPAEGRPLDTSELAVDSLFDLDNNWYATADFRYDFNDERATESGLGLGYRNECVEALFSASRSFAASTSVEATTSFGVTVRLLGFGAGSKGRTNGRSCS